MRNWQAQPRAGAPIVKQGELFGTLNTGSDRNINLAGRRQQNLRSDSVKFPQKCKKKKQKTILY